MIHTLYENYYRQNVTGKTELESQQNQTNGSNAVKDYWPNLVVLFKFFIVNIKST